MKPTNKLNWQQLPFLFICLGIFYFIIEAVNNYSGGKVLLILVFLAGAFRMYYKNEKPGN